MVCHETYRTEDKEWIEPEKVNFKNGSYWLEENGLRVELIKGRSEKMSKSKKNVVDPNVIISKYGADTARLFMISDSPPERDLEWSIEGIKSTFKYLNKIFSFLSGKLIFTEELKNLNNLKNEDKEIYDFTNRTISKFTEDIKNYRFNTAVAKLRQFSNLLLKSNLERNVFNFSWSIYLRLMYIIVPHFSQELASLSGLNSSLEELKWPVSNHKSFVKIENVTIVIQINGKKRAVKKFEKDITKEKLIDTIKRDPEIHGITLNNIKKVIFIPNKIINFVK